MYFGVFQSYCCLVHGGEEMAEIGRMPSSQNICTVREENERVSVVR